MRNWVIIGVPTSAGAHHAGQELAPAALRAAGLAGRLREAGLAVTDGCDLPVTPFEAGVPPYRNLDAVVGVARAVRDRVASVVADGGVPLVLGGDCTITLGVVAGFSPDVRLVYEDGDTDLGGLGDTESPSSGILDATGIAHLLGEQAPELAGLRGTGPLIDPSHLTLVGAHPRETSDAGRAYLKERGVTFQDGPALAADPAGVAQRALAAAGADGGPVIVHFDVDVVDSGDLPLANFPHYDSGVTASQAFACLRELCAHPSLAAVVLTEVNPTHDPAGGQLDRYLDGVVSALARLPRNSPAVRSVILACDEHGDSRWRQRWSRCWPAAAPLRPGKPARARPRHPQARARHPRARARHPCRSR
jgi:arginase